MSRPLNGSDREGLQKVLEIEAEVEGEAQLTMTHDS